MCHKPAREFGLPVSLLLIVALAVASVLAVPSFPPGTVEAGSGWHLQASGTTNDLYGVSALDESHVWAVGQAGTVLFWNGSAWKAQDSGTSEGLLSVHALDRSHVWAVGGNGVILFWNGSAWKPQDSGTSENLHGVWAVDAKHAWAVGYGGILFWNGSTWQPQDGGTTNPLFGVSAAGIEHAWAVGPGATVQFWNGSTWQRSEGDVAPRYVNTVFALDTTHVWAGGYGGIIFWDGTSWVSQPSGTFGIVNGISAVGASEAWAVGDGFGVKRWDGDSWSDESVGVTSGLNSVSALDSAHAWAVGRDGKILFYGETEATLRVLSPEGGEVVPSGSTCRVEWEAPGKAVSFNLKYSLNGGKTWRPMASGVKGTSYDWQVPTPLKDKDNCLIQVTAYDAGGRLLAKARSETPFSVKVLSLTSLNGGEVLAAGDTQRIIWDVRTAVPVAGVKLFYSSDGGATWTKVAKLEGTPAFYDWTVPAVRNLRDKCLVKVVLKDESRRTAGLDKSDAYFTIAPG